MKFVTGSTCVCNGRRRSAQVLDPYGHHLTSGCSCGGFRHRLHDDVKYELNSVIRYAGFRSRVEESGVLNQIIGNGAVETSGNNDENPEIYY